MIENPNQLGKGFVIISTYLIFPLVATLLSFLIIGPVCHGYSSWILALIFGLGAEALLIYFTMEDCFKDIGLKEALVTINPFTKEKAVYTHGLRFTLFENEEETIPLDSNEAVDGHLIASTQTDELEVHYQFSTSPFVAKIIEYLFQGKDEPEREKNSSVRARNKVEAAIERVFIKYTAQFITSNRELIRQEVDQELRFFASYFESIGITVDASVSKIDRSESMSKALQVREMMAIHKKMAEELEEGSTLSREKSLAHIRVSSGGEGKDSFFHGLEGSGGKVMIKP